MTWLSYVSNSLSRKNIPEKFPGSLNISVNTISIDYTFYYQFYKYLIYRCTWSTWMCVATVAYKVRLNSALLKRFTRVNVFFATVLCRNTSLHALVWTQMFSEIVTYFRFRCLFFKQHGLPNASMLSIIGEILSRVSRKNTNLGQCFIFF